MLTYESTWRVNATRAYVQSSCLYGEEACLYFRGGNRRSEGEMHLFRMYKRAMVNRWTMWKYTESTSNKGLFAIIMSLRRGGVPLLQSWQPSWL
jgi:hypothetical protein